MKKLLNILNVVMWTVVMSMFCSCGMFNVAGTTEEGNALADKTSEDVDVVPVYSSAVVADDPILQSSSSVVDSDAVITSPDKILSSSSFVPTAYSSAGNWPVSSSAGYRPVSSSTGMAYSSSVSVSASSGYIGFDPPPLNNDWNLICSDFGTMLWRGYDSEYSVNTGADGGNENSGYWYSFDDNADGGSSRIVWPVEMGNSYSDDAFDVVIDHCEGLCGTYRIEGNVAQPFAAVGFNIAGYDDSNQLLTADVSSWGGVCVAYESDADLWLVMRMKDYLGLSEYPSVKMPASENRVSARCYKWSDFESGEDAAKNLASLYFVIYQGEVNRGEFNIHAIGSYNEVLLEK